MVDHKVILDALGPWAWRLAHFVRVVLWKIFRPTRTGAMVIVINPAGAVLLVENSYLPGRWQLPGGGVDRGETPAQSACRELLEETALQVDESQLVPCEIYTGQQWGATVTVHVYKVQVGPAAGAAKADGVEILRTQWFALEQLPSACPNLNAGFIRRHIVT